MADKAGLKAAIKASMETLKTWDGATSGQTQEDATEKFAEDLANAIDTYAKTLQGSASPAQVTAAIMVAGTTPVTSSALLKSSIS